MKTVENVTFLVVERPDRPTDATHRKLIQNHLKKRQHNRSKSIRWRSDFGLRKTCNNFNEEEPAVRDKKAKAPTRFIITRWRHRSTQKPRQLEDHVKPADKAKLVASKYSKQDPLPSLAQLHQSPTTVGIQVGQSFSPLTALYPSRLNPFAIYPVEKPPESVDALIGHAVTYFWPGLYPSQRQGTTNPANAIFLPHLTTSKLAFCTYIMNISLSFDFQWGYHAHRQAHQMLRLQCMYEASKVVQEMIIQLPPRACGDLISDELIASVCCLSSASTETIVPKNVTANRFRSPLATAQHLDMWGTVGFSRPHRLAVVRLVNLKGGLHRLAFSGLAAIIQLADLIDSFLTLTQPLLPYTNYAAEFPPISTSFLGFRCGSCGSNQLNHPTAGFDRLPHEILCFDSLKVALMAAAQVTMELEQWHHDGEPPERLVDLCEARTRAHHMALSLRDLKSIPYTVLPELGTPDNAILFAVLRLSVLVYNNMVLFPLPAQSGIDTTLAEMLRSNIVGAIRNFLGIFVAYPELMLWMSMLGGISDSKDSHRIWYREKFEEARRQLDLRSWLQIEQHLSSFLWCGIVLNKEGVKFWLDV